MKAPLRLREEGVAVVLACYRAAISCSGPAPPAAPSGSSAMERRRVRREQKITEEESQQAMTGSGLRIHG